MRGQTRRKKGWCCTLSAQSSPRVSLSTHYTAHVVTSRGNLACLSTTSLLPDRPYVLVDQVELCDEGAGGGQVQEPGALVIHIQHLDSRVELYLKHPTLGQ